MADDVNASASSTEDSNKQDKSLEASEADTEISEGDESGEKSSKAQRRIQQLVKERDEARNFAIAFKNQAIDPKDRSEFDEWRKAKLAEAKKAEQEGEISPQRLAEIRRIMHQADPRLEKFLQEQEQEKERRETESKARMEAQFDDAEDEIRTLAAEQLGLKNKADEPRIARLAQYVMVEIQNDEKLMRKWQTGNLACIKQAFKAVLDANDNLGKSLSKARQEAADKRRISKLPTLPSAAGSLTGEKEAKREKGIGKQAHEDAWAVLQQSLQD